MADVNRGNRPLSPHLQVYRPQLNAITSILVRITGNALLLSAVLVVWWLLAAASSAQAFETADAVLTSIVGDAALSLSVLALWYHALGGLRHLIWDITGWGLDMQTADLMGWAMLGGSVILTVVTLILI